MPAFDLELAEGDLHDAASVNATLKGVSSSIMWPPSRCGGMGTETTHRVLARPEVSEFMLAGKRRIT